MEDRLKLFDSHCHLDMEAFHDDRDEVISRASEAGVVRLLLAACDEASSIEVLRMARNSDERVEIWASSGVHPHEASSVKQGLPPSLEALASNDETAAIGEIGLDYYYDNSPREIQRAAFELQLEWAARADKPVLVHLRNAPLRESGDAYGEAMSMIKNHPALERGGVIHCFSGDVGDARTALDIGFYISFAGPVTYPKAADLRSAAAFVPLDRILCETDSPYLAPLSRRGRRNEPALIRETYMKIAELRGISLESLAKEVWRNGERLFHTNLQSRA
ncbi:MAG: TatD family hydrolase [Synergistaceae bacterium]|jgi:TatD DNase family protein|nr:TatD family hydrolase [Synergistaceae bacterium]